MSAAPAPGVLPLSLHAAVQTLLRQEEGTTVLPHHGFATVVNVHGAEVAYATRVGGGWDIDAHGGYNWNDATQGWQGEIRIGKAW